jgi:hypothetical protein
VTPVTQLDDICYFLLTREFYNIGNKLCKPRAQGLYIALGFFYLKAKMLGAGQFR